MRMIIVGASGLIGKSLYHYTKASNVFDVIGTCFSQRLTELPRLRPFDMRFELLDHIVGELTPDDCVVLCGAIVSNLKVAENPGMARKVNIDGTLRCAEDALKADAQVIFLSSDAVFDDRITTGYQEINLPSPLTTYGKQKAMVEAALSAMKGRISIVRTGWVVDTNPSSHCPIRTIYRGLLEPYGMPLADDLLTTLTDIDDLCQGLHKIAVAKAEGSNPISLLNIFHIATNPPLSWHALGQAISNHSVLKHRMRFSLTKFNDLPFKEPRAKSAWLDSRLTCDTLNLTPKPSHAIIEAKVRRLDSVREVYAGSTNLR